MFICDKNYSCCDFQYWDRQEDVEQEARECGHLIEVVPVVHGRWIKAEQENGCAMWTDFECSVCGSVFDGNEWLFDEWKGCPVCLARMDGE